MGSAPVRRSWQTRAGSSMRRGGYVGNGQSGVYATRRGGSTGSASSGAGASTPLDLSPAYWWDAADATGTAWPAHNGDTGSDLEFWGDPDTDPPNDVLTNQINGHPAVDATDFGYQSPPGIGVTPTAFPAGITILWVGMAVTSNLMYFEMHDQTAGGHVTILADLSPHAAELLFDSTSAAIGGTQRDVWFADPTDGDWFIFEWTVDASGHALTQGGVPQTPTASSGTYTDVTRTVDRVFVAGSRVAEVLVYPADSAELPAARSGLASKYGLDA